MESMFVLIIVIHRKSQDLVLMQFKNIYIQWPSSALINEYSYSNSIQDVFDNSLIHQCSTCRHQLMLIAKYVLQCMYIPYLHEVKNCKWYPIINIPWIFAISKFENWNTSLGYCDVACCIMFKMVNNVFLSIYTKTRCTIEMFSEMHQ